MERAYSLFTIKTVDEAERIITGVASTPALDGHGDIVEPKGAQFDLPIPFTFAHGSKAFGMSGAVIGDVTAAVVTDNGIEITATIAKTADSASVREVIDQAWESIKSRLVRGLSIGIGKASKTEKLSTGGTRFIEWPLVHVSAVAVPANREATIQAIKSLDQVASDNVVRLSAETLAHINAPKRVGAVYLTNKRNNETI